MEKWEYRWVETDPRNDFELDKFGDQGWEAVSGTVTLTGAATTMGTGIGIKSTVWVLMKRRKS